MNKKTLYVEMAVVLAIFVLILGTGIFLLHNVLVKAELAKAPTTASWSFSWSFDTEDLKNKLLGQEKPPQAPAVTREYQLKKIKLFAAGKQIPAPKSRNYQEKFSEGDTQYVYVEISFQNPFYQERDSELPVTVEYYGPDGQLLADNKRAARPKKEWESALFIDKWGQEESGEWKPGAYKVKVYFQDKLVGETGFEIYQAAPQKKGEWL